MKDLNLLNDLLKKIQKHHLHYEYDEEFIELCVRVKNEKTYKDIITGEERSIQQKRKEILIKEIH